MGKSYELLVIGGGPGGYTAALQATRNGISTALIEVDFLGGTCLNRGCIPSKTLLKHAEVIEQIKTAQDWGIETAALTFSFDKMKKRKDEVIGRLRAGISQLMKQGKIDVYTGTGRILENGKVSVDLKEGVEILTAEKIIIATGSSPSVPPIPGLDTVQYETSDTIFDVSSIPESIVIIGGGVIGVEIACIFSSLNSKVTIVEAAERLVPGEDREVSVFIEKAMRKKGIGVLTGTNVENISEAAEKKIIECRDQKENELVLHTDLLLVSTGRKPNLSACGGISLEKDGYYIQVNDKMETSIPNIYAIGDVIGGWQLAHAASAEGIVAANNATGLPDSMDYKVMPRCIYTIPQVAAVGLTEEHAKASGRDIKVEVYNYNRSGMAHSIGETEGFTKIIYEAEYGEILGAIMAGAHVTEIISQISAFMYLEGTVDEMAKMIYPHPTISETIFEAALQAVRNG